MRFLFHHRIADRDGQAVHMEELIHALRDLGHEVILVGPPRFANASFGSENRLIGALKRALPKAAYEFLELAHNIPAFIRLYRAWRRHRPDAVYERNNLYLLAGAWLRRFTGRPFFLEINAPLFEERAAHDGIALPSLARRCQRFVWNRADAALPVTKVLADTVTAYGVPPARVHVVPNGVDPERFDAVDSGAAKARLGLDNRVVLGFTGFVRPWHGLDHVVSMLASAGNQCADMHLLIVGAGPAVPVLEAQARDLGVADRVTVTGVVGRESVAAYIAAFDIALQPSVTAYASPLKLFEYMAMAKPIVAPDQPNIVEVLTHDKDALLFRSGDPEDMVRAVLKLHGDPDLRKAMGRAARQTIIDGGYTWRRNAERLVAMVSGGTSA